MDLERPDLADNRVAAAFRIETCKAPREDLPQLAKKLATLLPAGQEPELRQTFTVWLRLVLQRTFPDAIIPVSLDLEEAAMLEETVRDWGKQLRREGRQEGRQEGRREGRIEGMRTLLIQMLAQRFGRVPARVRRRIAEIQSDPELRRLARQALVAESLRDLDLG